MLFPQFKCLPEGVYLLESTLAGGGAPHSLRQCPCVCFCLCLCAYICGLVVSYMGGWGGVCHSDGGFQCHNHRFLFQEVYPNLCLILLNTNEELALYFMSSLLRTQLVMPQIIKNPTFQKS